MKHPKLPATFGARLKAPHGVRRLGWRAVGLAKTKPQTLGLRDQQILVQNQRQIRQVVVVAAAAAVVVVAAAAAAVVVVVVAAAAVVVVVLA